MPASASVPPAASWRARLKAGTGGGQALTVRTVPRIDGTGGIAYEVLAASVRAGDAGNVPAPPPAPPDTGAARRYDIIRPVLKHAPGSAVREAARRAGVHERRIREWIAAYEAGGAGGLHARPREDRGRRKHAISAAWDSWAERALNDAAMAAVAADLERYVKSLWAATTDHGEKRIAALVADRLAELTEEAGFNGDARQLAKVCKVGLRFVRRWRHYRAVALADQDAKQWHDRHRPRIRRTREGRQPMDIVFCDVHPMDVLLPRADGSTFTVKLVAFLDWATNRIFLHPVFLAKGEGVRQEHVIEAIIAMTQDSRWGVPCVLYLDNGAEYGCVDKVADALRLNVQVRALGDDSAFDEALLLRVRLTVRAQPHNAPAKPIEPAFKVLEHGFFSALPGWIGGNRMAKKTANLGREPVPYPHGEEAFLADLARCLAAYHATPQDGALAGRSPDDAYNAAVAAGWQRMDIARGALLAAFGKDAFRSLRQGGFSYGGRRYTHRALQAMGADRRLHLRIPPFGDLDEMPVMDETGLELVCVAVADAPYDALDIEGAREAGRRLSAAKAGVARLRADTDSVDVLAADARRAARAGPAMVPESAGVIRLSEAMEAAGRALETAPAGRREAEEEQERISWEETRAARARFLRNVRATG